MELKFHPLANIFPLIEGSEFDALVNDINENGLREPIILLGDKILDGRNRYRACLDAFIEPEFVAYGGVNDFQEIEKVSHDDGHGFGHEPVYRAYVCPDEDEEGDGGFWATYKGELDDPVALVVSLNLRRRHLDESQRALVAAKLANLNKGGAGGVTKNNAQICALNEVSQSDAADMLNVSRRTVQTARSVIEDGAPELVAAVETGKVSVSAAADVATLPKPQQAEIVARGEKEILEAAKQIRSEKAEARRAERIEKIAEIAVGNAELDTSKKYPVIYADPPWQYEHVETENRAIENHYPTMTLEDICAMPVSELATDDAILFLWTTAPKLEESFRVINSWGFTYRSCAVWDKLKIGMGYYFRIRHELLLIATRGSIPTPSPSDRPPSVVAVERSAHSAKPEEFAEIIERFYPTLPKIELFCRSPRDGWDVWGNQSEAA